jgi:hypothetical protein
MNGGLGVGKGVDFDAEMGRSRALIQNQKTLRLAFTRRTPRSQTRDLGHPSRVQCALVGSFGTALLEALVEGLPALESGFYGVPVVDFCFA